MKRMFYLGAAILVAILGACEKQKPESPTTSAFSSFIDEKKPVSFGENNDVYLFAGGTNLERNAGALDSSIARTVTLTTEERYFNLIPQAAADIKDFSAFKNLVFLGTLDGGDGVSVYLRNTLSKDLLDKVKKSGADLLVAKNQNARDQIVLYLLASDTARLQQLVRQRSEQIFDYLLERYQLRLRAQAYAFDLIDAKFFDKWPFTINIPVVYQLFKQDRTGGFLSFIYQPQNPNTKIADKYVSVHFEPLEADQIDANWLFAKRQELGKKYLNGDEILPGKYKVERAKIAGYEGWRIYGHWINKTLGGGVGGAFQTYAFWHAKTKTAYLVDNIAYFPQGDKLPVLLELGTIDQTLSVK